jgi:hypothetical protein
MIESQILQTMQSATIAAVAMSITPDMPIKFVAVGLTPPNDQKYIEIVYIPNNDIGAYWGDEKNYRGMFRLILHWPNDGAGAYEPLDVLASICGYFTKGLYLGPVKITEPPDLSGVLEQGTETLYPASLRYSRFAS